MGGSLEILRVFVSQQYLRNRVVVQLLLEARTSCSLTIIVFVLSTPRRSKQKPRNALDIAEKRRVPRQVIQCSLLFFRFKFGEKQPIPCSMVAMQSCTSLSCVANYNLRRHVPHAIVVKLPDRYSILAKP
ncbi:hypothetical protein PsorP6_000496 [Peronosclerospora sorghi]|uniref:Uncharacterized protein n=1 Tax=Peronosclerospora sorghi TaxID=230839 RepID=A0ACC0WTU8_9STRA|nr:hypothetical protein PsorP6_000496 [Peronosclerospora sorghi]